MTFLQTAASALMMLIASIALGVFGLFHLTHHLVVPTNQTSSGPSAEKTATSSVATVSDQQSWWVPLAEKPSFFAIEDGKIHVSPDSPSDYELSDADPSNFLVSSWSDSFGKDHTHFYFEGQEVPDVDISTIVPVLGPDGSPTVYLRITFISPGLLMACTLF
jgi:hypothetical protein